MAETKQLLTCKDAAAMLECSTCTVKRMIAAGSLKAVRMTGPRGHIRINRRQVTEWLANS